MNAVSLDLASRSYDDIGTAVLEKRIGGIDVNFVRASELDLEGEANAAVLASKLNELSKLYGARQSMT